MAIINQAYQRVPIHQQSCMNNQQTPAFNGFRFELSSKTLLPFVNSHDTYSAFITETRKDRQRCLQKRVLSPEKGLLCSMMCSLFSQENSTAISKSIANMTYCSSSQRRPSSSTPELAQEWLNRIFGWQASSSSESAIDWVSSYMILSQEMMQAPQVDTAEKSESCSTSLSDHSEGSAVTAELSPQEAYLHYQNFTLYRQLQRKCRTLTTESSSQFEIIPEEIEADGRTTLMIRHIPNKYTQQMLLQEIPKKLRSSINFLYLPVDPYNQSNMGYAFVNFEHTRFIRAFFSQFSGRKWRRFNSGKICQLAYARIQGSNSLLMHFQHHNSHQYSSSPLHLTP